VRQLLNVQDLRTFETVLALCAARHGEELNVSSRNVVFPDCRGPVTRTDGNRASAAERVGASPRGTYTRPF
jgi:hypothetical protein